MALLQAALSEEGGELPAGNREGGWTALHRACYFGQFTAAKLLFEQVRGIAHAVDREGLTAAELLACDLGWCSNCACIGTTALQSEQSGATAKGRFEGAGWSGGHRQERWRAWRRHGPC